MITPRGKGAVAALRLSGDGAIEIAAQLFEKLPTRPQSHHAYVGPFCHGDHGIAICFLAPNSYTGEDVVELFTHGSPYSIDSLLESALQKGARLAARGEFTLRAFLNGKLDLTQAEAIPQIIDAESDPVFESAARQLYGSLKAVVDSIVNELELVLASIEAWVDFSEEIGDLDPSHLLLKLNQAHQSLCNNLDLAALAPKQRSGIKVVFVGPPNSGKSSLYNALLNEDRAIVTPIPGTTRDTLHANLSLKGVHLELVDTAGIRTTDDVIELEGIRRGLSEVASADVVIALVDLSDEGQEMDGAMSAAILAHPHVLLVGAKADLEPGPHSSRARIVAAPLLTKTSSKTGEGLAELARLIGDALPKAEPLPFLANDRHFQLMTKAESSLRQAISALQNEFPLDLMSACLRDSIASLNDVVGKGASADILETIFSQFCIGK